jgi:hypothetical protein
MKAALSCCDADARLQGRMGLQSTHAKAASHVYLSGLLMDGGLMSRMRVAVALISAAARKNPQRCWGRDESLREIGPSIIGFWGWCRVLCCVNRYVDASQLHYHWPYLVSCDVCCDIFVFIGILICCFVGKTEAKPLRRFLAC